MGVAFSIRNDINLLSTAAAAAACRTCRGRAEIDAGADFKTIPQKIHCHMLGLLIEVLVHDKLESIHIVDIVVLFRLIQSHCQ